MSTAQDMTHWLIAQLNHGRYGSRSVLSPAGIAEQHRPGVSTGSPSGLARGYGMGWVVGTSLRAQVIWHDGDDSCFHSDVRMAPQQNLGVVVLMNVSAVGSRWQWPCQHPAVVLASLMEANTPFGLGVPALLALRLMMQAALALRLVVDLRRGRLGAGPATVGWAVRHQVARLLINIGWAALVLTALLWLVANLATALPQLLLLLPWQVSLLLVSGAFAAAWALARTGLVVVVRARRWERERTC